MVSKEEEIKIPSIEKYKIINTLRIKQNIFSVKLLCETANVLRSSFYKWLKTSKLDKDQKDYEEIKEIFDLGKEKYGFRRIQMNLKTHMNHKKIIRIMRKYNLKTKVRAKNIYKNMTKLGQAEGTYSNIVNRNFNVDKPSIVFGTDITYLKYGSGKRAYLSVIKDFGTREIVSFKVSKYIDLKIVTDTLDKFDVNVKKKVKAIIHSDQGLQYKSREYINRIENFKMKQSMSRKGKCIDNAPTESFFGHFKDEVDLKECISFDDLRYHITQYLNYYNNHRYQWNLKKMTPVQYRNHLLS